MSLPLSEDQLKALIEHSADFVSLMDGEGAFRYVSPSGAAYLGSTPDKLLGRTGFEFIHPEDQAKVLVVYQTMVAKETASLPVTFRALAADGSWRWLEVFGTSFLDPHSGMTIVLNGRDITEKRTLENHLQRRMEMESLLASISAELVKAHCPADCPDEAIRRALANLGRFAGVDRCTLHQASEEGAIFQSTHEWCAEGIPSRLEQLGRLPYLAFSWITDRLRRFEDIVVSDPGELPAFALNEQLWLQARGVHSFLAVPLRMGDRLLGFLALEGVQGAAIWHSQELRMLRLVAEILSSALDRKRLFEVLKASEARYQALVEHQGEGLISVDAEECIVLANAAAETLFGVLPGELPGRRLREFLDEDQYAKVLQQTALRKTGVKSNYDLTLRRPDGGTRLILVSVVPVFDGDGNYFGANGIFHDVTERRRQEERLQRAKAHESLVLMAASVAHGFNNLLAVIQGNVELIRASLQKDQNPKPFLEAIQVAVARAVELSRLMLASAGHGSAVTERVEVESLLETLKLGLQTTFAVIPPIRFHVEKNLPALEVDPRQVHEVVHQLVANAVEAIEGRGDGALSITATSKRLDAEDLTRIFPDMDLKPGLYVLFSVSDNGCGMDPATQARIFEPFFTTKFMGRGLGLSSALGILTSYGAGIQVQSSSGKGSLFTIYFPVAASEFTQQGTRSEVLPCGLNAEGR